MRRCSLWIAAVFVVLGLGAGLGLTQNCSKNWVLTDIMCGYTQGQKYCYLFQVDTCRNIWTTAGADGAGCGERTPSQTVTHHNNCWTGCGTDNEAFCPQTCTSGMPNGSTSSWPRYDCIFPD